MRDSLRTFPPRLRAGWILPLALLTLPNCGQILGLDEYQNATQSGAIPRNSVIFCDIQQPPGPQCATADEEALGLPLEQAATALVSGESQMFGLDYSQTVFNGCGGHPLKIPFQGKFPDGFAACLNCSEIGATYMNAAAFCATKCVDLTKGDTAFCSQPGVVKLATNFTPECYGNACFDEGTFKPGFDDPRRHPDPVDWQNLVNITPGGVTVTPGGATLTRDTTAQNMFDAGADAPTQMITHGNAYVEFTAIEVDKARLCGLSEGPGDANPTVAGMSFALDLFTNGCVYVFESGVKAAGPVQTCTVPDAVGGYRAGDVFRVRVTDNLDGTGQFAPMGGHATVTYTRLIGSCMDGNVCPEETLWPGQTLAQYPLRVDSSFREQGGTLANVRIVRIRPQ